MLHELTIPDDLLAWGKQPERAKRWAAPWAHEVEKFLSLPQPLEGRRQTALFARLEALCAEAIREGEPELLLGLDTYTAARLGLRYALGDGERSVQIGAGLDFDYTELEAMITAKADETGAMVAHRSKELLSEVFPNVRVDAMLDLVESPEPRCTSCSELLPAISFEMESGNIYCRSCWSYLTEPWPRVEYRGTKLIVTRDDA